MKISLRKLRLFYRFKRADEMLELLESHIDRNEQDRANQHGMLEGAIGEVNTKVQDHILAYEKHAKDNAEELKIYRLEREEMIKRIEVPEEAVKMFPELEAIVGATNTNIEAMDKRLKALEKIFNSFKKRTGSQVLRDKQLFDKEQEALHKDSLPIQSQNRLFTTPHDNLFKR